MVQSHLTQNIIKVIKGQCTESEPSLDEILNFEYHAIICISLYPSISQIQTI